MIALALLIQLGGAASANPDKRTTDAHASAQSAERRHRLGLLVNGFIERNETLRGGGELGPCYIQMREKWILDLCLLAGFDNHRAVDITTAIAAYARLHHRVALGGGVALLADLAKEKPTLGGAVTANLAVHVVGPMEFVAEAGAGVYGLLNEPKPGHPAYGPLFLGSVGLVFLLL